MITGGRQMFKVKSVAAPSNGASWGHQKDGGGDFIRGVLW